MSREADVFINIPFDKRFEPLFVALVAGLTAFGAAPRSVIEDDPHTRRLDRLIRRIQQCGASISDLSRVQTSTGGKHRVPRFNMPFELGLIVHHASGNKKTHRWFVLEEKRHRLTESLTDLDGTDLFIHEGRPEQMLRFVEQNFSTDAAPPREEDVNGHHDAVRAIARRVKKKWGTLYMKGAFGELVYEARRAWERRAPRKTRTRR